MNTRIPLGVAALAALLSAAGIAGEAGAPSPPTPAAGVERGRYLVERVALCTDCHTERDWKGKQNRSRWLQGAKLPFKPTRYMPWAEVAPPIAGLSSFTNAQQAANYFQTGLKPDGSRSLPPMPQYRMSPEDAAAVVAYLRSLKPSPESPAK